MISHTHSTQVPEVRFVQCFFFSSLCFGISLQQIRKRIVKKSNQKNEAFWWITHTICSVSKLDFSYFSLLRSNLPKTHRDRTYEIWRYFDLKHQKSRYSSSHHFAKNSLPKNIILESWRLIQIVYLGVKMDLIYRCTWEKKTFYDKHFSKHFQLGVIEAFLENRQKFKFGYI